MPLKQESNLCRELQSRNQVYTNLYNLQGTSKIISNIYIIYIIAH